MIRKEDRNGNLICLIIYKHIKSCDYAVKIFNGITLFNMSLKVQLSQAPGTRPTPAPNNYANSSNKDRRRMSLDQNAYISSPNSAMLPPQQQQFSQLMSQQVQEFSSGNQFQNPYSDQINRSVSGSNLNFDEQQNHHKSRRSANFNQNRDNRGYSNDNRRNYSNNGNNYNHNRNGSNNQRQNSRENKYDRSHDQSQSPQRKRNRF